MLTDAPSHPALLSAAARLQQVHLRSLLADTERCTAFVATVADITLDFSRQKITPQTLDVLERLYNERGVPASMAANQAGAEQNASEGRSVLHTALRAHRSECIRDKDGQDVVPEVYEVLDRCPWPPS